MTREEIVPCEPMVPGVDAAWVDAHPPRQRRLAPCSWISRQVFALCSAHPPCNPQSLCHHCTLADSTTITAVTRVADCARRHSAAEFKNWWVWECSAMGC